MSVVRKCGGAGGNGFPEQVTHRDDTSRSLTKREYFAAVALQGILAGPGGSTPTEEAARVAVKAANDLIKELNK